MEQREIKLLVAGLGKLASDLFDQKNPELRLQVEDLEKSLIKLSDHDKYLLDFTVTCIPDRDQDINGHEIGDRISKALGSEWIPHLNDSETGQAFVYFNQQYLGKVAMLMQGWGVGKVTYSSTHRPFFIEISNWPKATKFWNDHTIYNIL